jgi:hypothetical protein
MYTQNPITKRDLVAAEYMMSNTQILVGQYNDTYPTETEKPADTYITLVNYTEFGDAFYQLTGTPDGGRRWSW